ncbi:MAG: tetratricopeptide repeat protein [Thermoguttaceae bacterium]|jgi:Flp pilus assembly protein TadD
MSKQNNSSKKLAPQAQLGTYIPSALRLRVSARIALIVGAVLIVYLPSISGGFILDDDNLLTNSPIVKTSDGLYRFWCTSEAPDYWPVTNTTFWIEWRIWGMHPTGYHITNLILHIVASLLIWLILRKLSIPGAFWAAMIFAVHPVNVESVAWIAQRKNLMAMFFFLLSILCYLKAEMHSPPQNRLYRPQVSRWYWFSLTAFVLAMLSKGSVAILPVLLVEIVWWLRHITRWDLLRTAPFFLAAVTLTGVNVWFRTHGLEVAFRNAGFIERMLGAGGAVWFYLDKALFPVDLTFVYAQWHIKVDNPLWWLPLLAVLIVTSVLWRYQKGWSRPFLFAWGFFCIALIPVMGFVNVGFMKHSLVADHYQHIALIAVIALAAALWSTWYRKAQGAVHWSVMILPIVAAGALAFQTWAQSGLYYDKITLYQVTLEKNPEFWMGQYNLGNALADVNRLSEAIEHYKQALQLNPDYFKAHNNLGVALVQAGQYQEAIEHYRQSLKLNPDYPDAYYNLGIILDKTGHTQEAMKNYEQALRLKPNDPEVHNNLGKIFLDIGRLPEAIEHFEQALRLNPDYPTAHYNMGKAFVKKNRTQEAIEHFQQTLRLKPDFTDVYFDLASAYANMHHSSDAIGAAQKALELARSQGQKAQAKEIEDWLNAYRAHLSGLPNESLPSNSAHPPP